MGLPTIAVPKYTLTVPSSGQQIEYRPFLVKEEKILLLANESKDEKEQIRAMKQAIENCTFGKVDVNTLASFDVEYLFLKLRSKSVGETVEVGVKCSECETNCPTTIDLSTVEVNFNPKFSNRIALTETIGVLMRYPTYEDMSKISDAQKKEDNNSIMDFVASCVDKIYDGQQIYNTVDFTKQEVLNFLEELSQSSLRKIMSFFELMPSLQKEIKVICKKCNKESEVMLKGAQSFFQSV